MEFYSGYFLQIFTLNITNTHQEDMEPRDPQARTPGTGTAGEPGANLAAAHRSRGYGDTARRAPPMTGMAPSGRRGLPTTGGYPLQK